MVEPAGTSTHTTESIPAMSQKASFRFLEGEALLEGSAAFIGLRDTETFQKSKSFATQKLETGGVNRG
jgi:hypothetical protein